ncbi:MAG: TIGR02391 family protein [Planctomycetes bacterium]|nr:TIGR02391 family protein [Planctomycetota bacterium]
MTLRELLQRDRDAFAALAPEELAGYLLADIIRWEDEPGRGDPNKHNYLVGISPDKKSDIGKAILEAWAYLEHERLIASVGGDWVFVTRRGREVGDATGVAEYQKIQYPRGQFHAAIEHRTWKHFIPGDHDIAVKEAFREVEIRIRKAAALPKDYVGAELVKAAFAPDGGKLTDTEIPSAERTGLFNLFLGGFLFLRNPAGHRDVEYEDPTEALEAFALASMLARIVDRAAERLAADAE